MPTARASLLALAATLLLIGCPPVRGDDDDSATCTATTGTLHACVVWDAGGEPLAGAMVSVRADPEEEPIDALAGDDGCVEIDLEAGIWEVSGRNSAGDCVSPFVAHDLVSCETLELEIAIVEWCMDGF